MIEVRIYTRWIQQCLLRKYDWGLISGAKYLLRQRVDPYIRIVLILSEVAAKILELLILLLNIVEYC